MALLVLFSGKPDPIQMRTSQHGSGPPRLSELPSVPRVVVLPSAGLFWLRATLRPGPCTGARVRRRLQFVMVPPPPIAFVSAIPGRLRERGSGYFGSTPLV